MAESPISSRAPSSRHLLAFRDLRASGIKLGKQNPQERCRAAGSRIEVNLARLQKACPAGDHDAEDLAIAGDTNIVDNRCRARSKDVNNRQQGDIQFCREKLLR